MTDDERGILDALPPMIRQELAQALQDAHEEGQARWQRLQEVVHAELRHELIAYLQWPEPPLGLITEVWLTLRLPGLAEIRFWFRWNKNGWQRDPHYYVARKAISGWGEALVHALWARGDEVPF